MDESRLIPLTGPLVWKERAFKHLIALDALICLIQNFILVLLPQKRNSRVLVHLSRRGVYDRPSLINRP